MEFMICIRNCDEDPAIAQPEPVRAADDDSECVKTCDDHLNTCDISIASLVNSRQIGSFSLSLGVDAMR